MIDMTTFYECLAQPTARGYDLDDKQKQAVEYEGSPLWLIAGPGSGKSETGYTYPKTALCRWSKTTLYSINYFYN